MNGMAGVTTHAIFSCLFFCMVNQSFSYIIRNENISLCLGISCENGGTLNEENCHCSCTEKFNGMFCETKVMESKWPRGRYALPMTLDECPETDRHGWTTGFINMTIQSRHRYQMWNDKDNLTFEPHLMGPYHKRILQMNFCVKENPDNGVLNTWPNGKYCIYQVGDDCPIGFISGSTTMTGYQFTTDDTSGVLPKTNVTRDDEGQVISFEIFYCCKNDSAKGSFTLIDNIPFFVLKYGEDCPNAEGGRVSEETFKFTIGDDPWSFNAPHPSTSYRDGDKNVDLVYCYYSPLDLKECYYENDHGYSYNGEMSVSESGRPCLDWSKIGVIKRPDRYTGDFRKNHCRMYRTYGNPWLKHPPYKPLCFVSATEWEYCPVPSCDTSNDQTFLRPFKPVYAVPHKNTQAPEHASDSITGGTSFVTERPYIRPWVQVDMEHFYEVYHVLVHRNQRYYPKIFRHVNIYVSKHQWDFIDHGAPLCEGFKIPFRAPLYRFNCRRPLTGQFVTIRNFDFTDVQGTVGRWFTFEIGEIYISVKDTNCGRQLGLTSGGIYDFQLNASSLASDYEADSGRLMGREGVCLKVDDRKGFFQVDLIVPMRIQGVLLQGWKSGCEEKYIDSFSVSYSIDHNNFLLYEDPIGHKKVFKVDRGLVVEYPQRFLFAYDVLATVIRINVEDFDSEACFKLDLIGCPKRVERDLMCDVNSQFIGWEVLPGYAFWLHEDKSKTINGAFDLKACMEQCMIIKPPCIALDTDPTDCSLKTGHRYFRLSKSFIKRVDNNYETAHRLCITGVSELTHCGGTITEPTLLVSPSYPLYYGTEVNCSWIVTFPTGTNIQLDVLEIHLPLMESPIMGDYQLKTGKCEDLLVVENPLKNSFIILSDNNTGSTFYSDGNQIVLRLTSCHRYVRLKDNHQEIGFVLNITNTDCAGCGFDNKRTSHLCSQNCGYLASPNFPAIYNRQTKRQWRIIGEYGQFIEFIFLNLDIPSDKNCNEAHVAVYDVTVANKESLLGKYCRWNRVNVNMLRSSWHTLLIEFFAEFDEQGSGFLAKYNMIDFEFSLNESRSVKDCAEDWMAYDNSCYNFFTENSGLTWFAAEDECHKKGGHLASIHGKNEMTYLHYLMTTLWNVTTPVFIGLQKLVVEQNERQHFMWTDGSPLTYMDWQSDSTTHQPDGHTRERCTVIRLSSLWSIQSWHDFMCAYDRYTSFICEISSVSNSEMIVTDPTNINIVNKSIGTYICKNGEVIQEIYECDGVSDCRDSSDEDACDDICHEGGFECADGTCISISFYCDYKKDCPDGSDEEFCVSRVCNETEWKCANGQCIPKEQRCNFKSDCTDRSDEAACDLCNHKGFQCYDQSCIPRTIICDGFVDCSGEFMEDEDQSCMNNAQESCAAWYDLGKTKDGIYMVNYGEPGIFAVECRFLKEQPGTVMTLVHHPYEDRIIIPDAMQLDIPFSASTKQLKKLKKMNTCHQFIKIQCRFADLDGKIQFGFQDGSTDKLVDATKSNCKCLLTKACEMGKETCNCNADNEDWNSVKSYEWYTDEGYIDKENLLPLRTLSINGVASLFKARAAVTIGPLICTGNVSLSSSNFLCKNNIATRMEYRCILDTDETGEILGCRDLSHLEDCVNARCNENYLKCPHSFCIPRRMYCDGVKQCADGSDEKNCSNVTCPGLYRCRDSHVCLPMKSLCDGVKHCENGDDELMCNHRCPSSCDCKGLSYKCSAANIFSELPADLRKIDVSFTNLSGSPLEIGNLSSLADLNVSNCELKYLGPDAFLSLSNLYRLDIDNNKLTELKPEVFRGLNNLNDLHLDKSRFLTDIYPGSFEGLSRLPNLSLTYTRLQSLQSHTFRGLNNLTYLNLSHGKISNVADYAFYDLKKLRILDLSGNTITKFSKDIFAGLSNLHFLYTDSQTLCCLRPSSVERINCLPGEDEFSSCTDLMRNSTLRMFLWIIGGFALLGNAFVIIYRLFFDRETLKKSYGIFVANLGLSDFFMGVYLFIIASADQYYRDEYIWNDYTWRNGSLCKFTGFLAVLSSESSTIILCFITLDRVIAIKFPFSRLRFTFWRSVCVSVVVWVFTISIASLPLMIPSYFHDSFYSKTGVCLALPFTRERPPGWEYSTALFIFFNFIAFVIIAFGQGQIYMEIRSAASTNLRKSGGGNDLQIARNLFLVVITDFICWFPIGIIGMIALSGYPIHSDAYAWTAVFVLPINSALNPILYTATAIIRKKEKGKMNAYVVTGNSRSTTNTSG